MGNLPSFFAALELLGKTNQERANAIPVTLRTFYNLKKGRLGPMNKLMKRPELVEALLEDARNGHTNGNHDDLPA